MNLKKSDVNDTHFKRLVNKRLPYMKRNIRFYNQIYKVYFESTRLKKICESGEKESRLISSFEVHAKVY